MSAYEGRPWLALYDEHLPSDLEPDFAHVLAAFRTAVRLDGDRPCLHYFGGTLTLSDVDLMSDALAVGFHGAGVGRGNRVALYLQNVPQFVLALLATWKLGAVAVPVNPMYRQRELTEVLIDTGARLLVTLESLHAEVASTVVVGTSVETVVTTSELDLARERRGFLETARRVPTPGTADLLTLIQQYAGAKPEAVPLSPEDVALLTYTSGTTGPSKGAMNTHGNVVFNAQAYRDWVGLGERDVCYALAPLFHITGLVAHIAVSLLTPMPMVLGYRFDPDEVVRGVEKHQATFTIGSITAFIALLDHPHANLSSLDKVYSGGAPIAPATLEAFRERYGVYVRNAYGLTETTSPSHLVPSQREAPVDADSGALSIGVPIFSTRVRIVDEDGRDVPVGEIGELWTRGPQVVPGYWQRPHETATSLGDGWLRTGDVGFMDADGWMYLVDRKKDQINAAGFKVWPREVEDVLYEHPAVREAGVVGVPHDYRGETVVAFVSLREGRSADAGELVAFARERLAAFKVPREVRFLDELPKTLTGKVRRRDLRELAAPSG